MAKIQYSKKLRRLLARLHQINRRIAEAYQAAPDEIVSTPFDGSSIVGQITIPHYTHAPANAVSAANPASPTPPQSPAAPLPAPGCATSGQASVPPQPAPQSENERQLWRRCERLKRYAAKQQVAVLERRVQGLQQLLAVTLAQVPSLIRRKSVSDSFLRSDYFDQWLEKYGELITELDVLLKGMTDDA